MEEQGESLLPYARHIRNKRAVFLLRYGNDNTHVLITGSSHRTNDFTLSNKMLTPS